MWTFALVLAVIHGASCTAHSSYWVQGALKCSELRVIVEPDKNLAETPEDFYRMCKLQKEYYRCLDILVGLLGPNSMSELHSETARERSLFKNLCSLDSPWSRRYLEFAHCINMQHTDFCRTPEFLGADGMDPNCSCAHEKMENCIAATLSMKCGFEAGQLFHYLLKMKAYGMHLLMETTYTDSEPSSDGNPSAESAFGEVYDKLVKKIGYIPEQDSSDLFFLRKREGHMHEDTYSVDEDISSSLEMENLDSYSHIMEHDGSEDVEHAVSDDNGSVSEVKTSTLDAVHETSDDDLPEEPFIRSYVELICFHLQYTLARCNQMFGRVKNKNQLIAVSMNISLSSVMELFRSSGTLIPEENYETVRIFPDGRINYYSRRRDNKELRTIKCYNFPGYFVCINMPRSEYPLCLKTTVFTGPREGEFFPEEFDPEFGAQWHETIPKEAYVFEPWVHQSIDDETDQLSYTPASVTEDAQTSYVPVDRRSEDGEELIEDLDSHTRIVSKEYLHFNEIKNSITHVFATKDNETERIMDIFKAFITNLPSASKIEIKNWVPENVAEALVNLCDKVSFENIAMRLDDVGNVYIFWNNQQESVIDTITCGKVNECHPKGEGIWKCVIVPKTPIETDGFGI